MRILCSWIAFAVLLLLLGSVQVTAEEASTLPTSAHAAILMDQYGQVLYANNADAALPMASTTKIMTALVALELADPDVSLTIPKEAVGIEGSSAYLMEGENMTLLTLLYALMLESANDAATAIAVCLSGSIEAFAREMNRKASELGLTHTHFTNPHGLDDPNHYTSASDLGRITAEALKNPVFARIVSTVRYQVPVEDSESARLFVNHNRLLREYDGCIGVKTGFTKRTGRCLVSAAQRNGIILIAVTLNDPDDWQDHKRLLNYGFSRCEQMVLSPEQGIAMSIPVVGGIPSRLLCRSIESAEVTLPKDSRPTMVIELPHWVFGGVSQGKQLGRAVWYLNGEEVAELPLYAVDAAEAIKYPPTLWERIVTYFAGIIRFFREMFQN